MELVGVGTYRLDSRSGEVLVNGQHSVSTTRLTDEYYRTVLPMLWQAEGLEALHASGIVADAGVIALCADSGAGKSTIACGLHRRGYALWADDAVAFDKEARFVTYPLPFQLYLRPEASSYFESEGSSPARSSRGQDDCAATRPRRLAAMFILEKLGADEPASHLRNSVVRIRRLSAAAAFTALLNHSYCFSLHDLDRKHQMLENYLDLASQEPVYSLCFRSGLRHLPDLLDVIEPVIRDLTASIG